MKKDLISIIIPSYNTGEIIIDTLNCVKNQTYKNYEVIIVDDGSKEENGKIIKNYIKKNKLSNFYYFYKNNGGVSSARNFGIDKANGEYILFADSDDIFSKDLLKELYKSIKDNKTDLAVGNLKIIFNNKESIGVMNVDVNNNLLAYKSSILSDIYTLKNFNGYRYEGSRMCYCKLWKTSIIKDNKIYFDEKLYTNEDGFFNLNYLNHINSVSYVKKDLYTYLKSQGHSREFRKNKIEERRYKVNTIYDYVCKNNKDLLLSCNTYILSQLTGFITSYLMKNEELSFRDRVSILKKEYNDLYKDKISIKSYKYISGNRKLILILLKLRLYIFIILLFEIRKK